MNVIGVRTFETVPGLKRHLRNALVAALSRIALPVLCAIVASVTDPLDGSTVMMQTPLPVSFERRASYGYSGFGALIATAFADDMDIGPALGTPAGFGRAIGTTGLVGLSRFGGGVGFSSTNSGTSVGSGGCSVGSDSSVTVFGEVHAIALAGTNLYVGGSVSFISPNIANFVARWNGANWEPLGTGVDAPVTSLAAIDGNLYVGGTFTTAGGIRVNHIAKWDGATWSSLGSGANGEVDALAVSSGALYIGGNFTTAGQNQSAYFGIWHPPGSTHASFQANAFSYSNGSLVITWNSQPGQMYQILSSGNLSQPFSPLGGLIPSGGTTTSYTNSVGALKARFFRIKQ